MTATTLFYRCFGGGVSVGVESNSVDGDGFVVGKWGLGFGAMTVTQIWSSLRL